MAADNLDRPLNRRNIVRRLLDVRLTALQLVLGVVVFGAMGLFAWLSINPNPLGGEPVVILALDSQTAQSDVTATELGMRNGLKTDETVSELVEEGQEDIAETELAEEPQTPRAGALPKVPVDGLVEHGQHGILPRIGTDGRRPSQAYARQAPQMATGEGTPARIAILIGGMGLSNDGTRNAIDRLPGEVTLAFAPYPEKLQKWITRARRSGHEVMLQLPMEPFDYPDNDPGPYTLLTHVSPQENINRLEWLLSRFTGYFGVTNYMGAKFTSNSDALRPALKQISARGLVYVDDGTSGRSQSQPIAEEVGLGASTADVVIDGEQTANAIENMLATLEEIALERGLAIGVGSGLPVTIDSIARWAQTLEDRNIILIPVSAAIPTGSS